MICPRCRTPNDDEYVFCVNCGTPINSLPKTEEFPSVATAVAKDITTPAAATIEYQPRPTIGQASVSPQVKKSSPGLRIIVIIGAVFFLFIAITGLAAFLYFGRKPEPIAQLPQYLGLFAVDSASNRLNEIAKREFPNARDGREAIMKEQITTLPPPAEFILYAETGEIKTDDLKLVRIDSITDDGSMRNFDFQVVPIENKPAMKRLKLANPVANGRYAFALFSGSFDDGKHKFWPFEIAGVNATSTDAGRDYSVALKEKPPSNVTKTPGGTNTNATQTVPEVPVGARVAFCNSTDVFVRAAPSLNARRVSMLRRGQKVYLLGYSENFDLWNGVKANWAQVQTENGKRGWVFTPFISY